MSDEEIEVHRNWFLRLLTNRIVYALHLFTYIMVNGLLIMIWLVSWMFTGLTYFWPFHSLFGWGFGVAGLAAGPWAVIVSPVSAVVGGFLGVWVGSKYEAWQFDYLYRLTDEELMNLFNKFSEGDIASLEVTVDD